MWSSVVATHPVRPDLSSLGMLLVAVLCLMLPSAAGGRPGPPNGELITLDDAVALALERNASLRSAEAARRAAGHRTRRARLELLPKADLELTYARLDPASVRRGNVFVDVGRQLLQSFSPESDPNDIRPAAYDNNFATTLRISQPIYNGGAQWAAVGLARAREHSSNHEFENTRQEVILRVKRSYLQALQAQELVTLARKTLESSERHLRTVRRMLELGLRSRTEVLRWEVQLAEDRGRLIEAENSLKVALAAVKQATGLPFAKEISLSPLPFEPEPLTESLETQIRRLQSQHPALNAINASLDASRAGVRMAWATLQPRVNFVYELGWERNNTLALDSFTFWSAGVRVDVPIFHSLSNLARVQESKAEVRRAEEQRTETERALILQLVQARSRVETALEKYKIAGKAVEQARENLRVLDNTFEAGLAANIDVLDAQVILTRAETNWIAARYAYWIARAELQKAMGVLER